MPFNCCEMTKTVCSQTHLSSHFEGKAQVPIKTVQGTLKETFPMVTQGLLLFAILYLSQETRKRAKYKVTYGGRKKTGMDVISVLTRVDPGGAEGGYSPPLNKKLNHFLFILCC